MLFYKQKANDVVADLSSVVAEQIVRQGEPLTEDIKSFLLGTSDYANKLQFDIDLYVTRGKHNQASFRRKLDPVSKNIWRKENPLELLFEDVSKFDAQNPVIGSLLKEIDHGKKQSKTDPLSSPSNLNDVILRRRFENLRRTDQPFNADSDGDNDNDNDDNGLGLPPSPLNYDFLRPTAPPLSPPILSPQRLVPTAPPIDENTDPTVPPPYSLFTKKDDSTGTSVTPGEQVMSEIECVIEKEKEENKVVVPDDPLLEYFKGINDVLDENYRFQKENDQSELERFNRDYGLDKLADELNAGIDSGDVPKSLEFYFCGVKEKNFSAVRILAPNPANLNFIDILAGDFGSRLMREKALSIHIKTGDLYYKDLNKGESIYSFILSQQDESKKIMQIFTIVVLLKTIWQNFQLELTTKLMHV